MLLLFNKLVCASTYYWLKSVCDVHLVSNTLVPYEYSIDMVDPPSNDRLTVSKNAAAESSKQYASSLSICQMCSRQLDSIMWMGQRRLGTVNIDHNLWKVGGSTNYRRFPKNQSCAQCMANKSSNIGKYRNNKLFISNVFIWLFHFRRFKNWQNQIPSPVAVSMSTPFCRHPIGHYPDPDRFVVPAAIADDTLACANQ